MPLRSVDAKALAQRIFADCIGVAEDLEGRAIVSRKNGLDISAKNVIAQIGRNVANAQRAIGTAVVGVRRGGRGQRIGESLSPGAMLIENGLGRGTWVKPEG